MIGRGMTSARRRLRIGVAAGLVLGLAVATPACATRGSQSGAGDMQVRVQNTLMPPTSLTVSLLPATGARRMLGVVTPSDTAVLRVDGPVIGMQRLIAETTDGSAIASRTFTASETAVVEWNVGMNIIRVIGVR